MSMNIAINGFGRIGRAALRILLENTPEVNIVAINDLTPNEAMLHLFKYDSTMGKFDAPVQLKDQHLHVAKQHIQLFSEKDPSQLPWKKLNVDLVLECTGVFRHKEKLSMHIQAGAKKVLLSAPPKDDVDCMIVHGINDKDLKPEHTLISNASCTTNCLAQIAKVIHENFVITSSFMSTIHAYTNDQRVLDVYHRDLRRARAAAQNIIPTTTGAATAVTKVLPELVGKIDGSAIRVPVLTGSLVDFHAVVEKDSSIAQINQAFENAAEKKPSILKVTHDPIVSSDIIGDSASAIVDASLTDVQSKLVRVVAWYDNEWGYASRLIDVAKQILLS